MSELVTAMSRKWIDTGNYWATVAWAEMYPLVYARGCFLIYRNGRLCRTQLSFKTKSKIRKMCCKSNNQTHATTCQALPFFILPHSAQLHMIIQTKWQTSIIWKMVMNYYGFFFNTMDSCDGVERILLCQVSVLGHVPVRAPGNTYF